jgi:N-succinyl-L-ornithine transcarbamylase
MKNFISVQDVANIDVLVQKAIACKANPLKDKALGANKRIGLLFLNPSMRTRLSTQIAALNLGMEAIVFNADKDGWKLEFEDGAVMNSAAVEHIRDAAPVMGAYFDILCIRTFPSLVNREEDYSEVLVNQLIKYSGIPVVSLESATLHPLQSFTDLITITETFKEARKPKIVLTWAPHIKPLPQCVANSFAQWVNAWGKADFVVTHPKGFELDTKFTDGATIEHDQQKALQDADYVYVKNWSSYSDYGKMASGKGDWKLTEGRLARTNNAKIMHCLPVRRNVELSDEVLDGTNSLVSQQAANRVWAAQTVLSEILTGLN